MTGYTGRHRATAEPSQVAYPWRSTLRTMVQVGIPTLVTLLLVVPEIIEILLDGYGESVPDGLRTWLLSASALIVATSGVLARVMAIPAVNSILERVRLGAEPKEP